MTYSSMIVYNVMGTAVAFASLKEKMGSKMRVTDTFPAVVPNVDHHVEVADEDADELTDFCEALNLKAKMF